MESYTFEARQYSAYRLVRFKHDQQGQQQYGPQSTQTGLRHPGTLSCRHTYISSSFLIWSQFSINSILYSISHILKYKEIDISRVTANYSTSTL